MVTVSTYKHILHILTDSYRGSFFEALTKPWRLNTNWHRKNWPPSPSWNSISTESTVSGRAWDPPWPVDSADCGSKHVQNRVFHPGRLSFFVCSRFNSCSVVNQGLPVWPRASYTQLSSAMNDFYRSGTVSRVDGEVPRSIALFGEDLYCNLGTSLMVILHWIRIIL